MLVRTCLACGEENPWRARFCLACGAALTEAAPPVAARKTVTILFCDVAESTALGEGLDPESLRRIMAHYFELASTAVRRHGGAVEKFIGDAVMAVFGVPRLHEDDALRALRAATDLRAALSTLNDRLGRELGVRLTVRTGINTGEVVAGDPEGGQAFVTGDAVNVAKRLEASAAGGEILVGETTRRLVRDAALLEPVEPLTVKGKSEPLRAWRLLAVVDGSSVHARRLDTPLVGRTRELEQLRAAFERVQQERLCAAATVLGAAGIGKSRLAYELFELVGGRATVLLGRCLPYGDGITFFPIVEMLRDLGGGEAVATALEGAVDAALIAERVRGTIAPTGSAVRAEESFWALRKLFGALARQRPLILCFEDLHWAEPTLLDLLDYLLSASADEPVLVLCTARTELQETQGPWLAGRAGSDTLVLEPLSDAESRTLLAGLSADTGFTPEARERVAEAAEGNPLFLEQMVALLAEGGGEDQTPPTLHALLAARLDRLLPSERAVLERAAVVGKEFARGAVADLLAESERGGLGAALMSLVRKEFIRLHRPEPAGDDTLRFRHVLIRDEAYAAMPKELRARLHAHHADWVAAVAGDGTAGQDELVGYHLEQAYRLREELGLVDGADKELAARAGALLGAAGRRAFSRDDMPAALNLLDRAVALLTQEHPARLELVRELSGALWALGEVARAESLLSSLLEAATAAGDQRMQWHALLEGSTRRLGPTEIAEIRRVAEGAIEAFTALGDDAGLASAWRRLALSHRLECRHGPAEEASERALVHARRAGSRQEESRNVDNLCTSLLYGPAPAEAAIERCEGMLAQADDNPVLEAAVMCSLAGLYGMRGRFEEARELIARAEVTYTELGLRLPIAGLTQITGAVELLADEAGEAERHLQRGFAILAEAGRKSFLAAQAAFVARALYAQDRFDEAFDFATLSRAEAASDDLASQILWRGITAQLDVRKGEGEVAEEVAREAVALAERTDDINLIGDAYLDLAEILQLRRSPEAAAEAAHRAARLYARKGNLVSERRAVALASPVVR